MITKLSELPNFRIDFKDGYIRKQVQDFKGGKLHLLDYFRDNKWYEISEYIK